jgi:hypothetical protein
MDIEPFHIDHRIFPYLGIDQPLEGKRTTASSMIRFACAAMFKGVLT